VFITSFVFEQVGCFSRVEVLRFEDFLGGFDAAEIQPGFDGHALS